MHGLRSKFIFYLVHWFWLSLLLTLLRDELTPTLCYERKEGDIPSCLVLQLSHLPPPCTLLQDPIVAVLGSKWNCIIYPALEGSQFQ